MRTEIFNKLKEVTTTYNVGKHKGHIIEPTAIVKFNNQLASANNSKGGFQRFEVMCYSPVKESITLLDTLIDNVIFKMNEIRNINFKGEITPEIVDDDKKAYMRSVYFYIPKEVR